MPLAADYPFLEVMWTMFIFFAWVMVVGFVIMCLIDNFRRHDHSGWAKAGWTLVIIAVPLIGALIYQIARPKEVPYGDERTIYGDGDYATPTAGRDEATRIRTGL